MCHVTRAVKLVIMSSAQHMCYMERVKRVKGQNIYESKLMNSLRTIC